MFLERLELVLSVVDRTQLQFAEVGLQQRDVVRIGIDAALRLDLVGTQVVDTCLAESAASTSAALDLLPPASYGPNMVESAGTLAMAAADADLAIADAGVQLAKSQRVPDVTVGPALRRLEVSKDIAAVFSVSIPIPLFNSGRAAVAQASAERSRAEAQRRMTALDVEQAITDAQAEADNAATTARNASGPALVAAQEAARIARVGYREGKFGQLDLLDAERTLADTRVAAIDALASYQNAKARLQRLTAPAPEQGN